MPSTDGALPGVLCSIGLRTLGLYSFSSGLTRSMTPLFFNDHIASPLKRDPERTLKTLKKLVQAVSLRRTKDSVIGELQLSLRGI